MQTPTHTKAAMSWEQAGRAVRRADVISKNALLLTHQPLSCSINSRLLDLSPAHSHTILSPTFTKDSLDYASPSSYHRFFATFVAKLFGSCLYSLSHSSQFSLEPTPVRFSLSATPLKSIHQHQQWLPRCQIQHLV